MEAITDITDNNSDAQETSSLTEPQEKAISLLPIPSSILSICGSLTIIWLITRRGGTKQRLSDQNKSNAPSPYKRLMLGMSICDCFTSILFVIQPFFLPESSERVYSIGSDVACSFSGFLHQFSTSSFWYSSLLSLYFVVRANEW